MCEAWNGPNDIILAPLGRNDLCGGVALALEDPVQWCIKAQSTAAWIQSALTQKSPTASFAADVERSLGKNKALGTGAAAAASIATHPDSR